MTQTAYKTETGKVYNGHIEVVHNRDQQKIHFSAHPAGPNFFTRIMEEITGRNLEKSTAPEVTSLIYHAYTHKNEAYSDLIIDTVRNAHLFGDTGILVVKGHGAIVQDHPTIRDGQVVMDYNDLIGKIDNKTVRWAACGYKLGHLSSREVEHHSLISAICRPEGAEKIAKVIRDHKGDRAYVGDVPDLSNRKGKGAANIARVASFMAKKKDLFWIVSEYPDAHADIFGFSYPIIRRKAA